MFKLIINRISFGNLGPYKVERTYKLWRWSRVSKKISLARGVKRVRVYLLWWKILDFSPITYS